MNLNQKMPKKARIAASKAIILTTVIMIIAWILQSNFSLVINRSESLPITAVIVKKGKIPTKIDQIFVFKVRNNPHYQMAEMNFIKLVGGLPGDVIAVEKIGELEEVKINTKDSTKFNNITNSNLKTEIYINDKLIAIAKAKSLKGKTLTAINSGIIPADKFFAYTPHKDSFDSRYQDLGFIDAKDIIGTAITSF